VDVDRTGFPNLALMKLSAWHKAQGHETVLLRDPGPLSLLMQDKVYASCVFSWNRDKAEMFAELGAEVGGKGYRKGTKLPREVHAMRPDYDLYGIDYGVGFLSRGCIRNCSFCSVPEEEGLPWLDQPIDDLLNPRSRFLVLMDNEFFWNIKWAIAQMEEFTRRGIDWCPSQGLDIRCTTPPLCNALAASPFWNVHHTRKQITFAFDDGRIERRYRQGVEMLFKAGIKAWQLQSFVLVGFDTAASCARPLHADDHHRLAVIREYGIDPFVMVYRDPQTGQAARDPELRNFARWVNRRLYKTCSFDGYWPEMQRREVA
jgi:hypothetical protein